MSLVIIFPAIYLNCTISPITNSYDKFFPSKHIVKNKISILITVPSFILFMKANLPKNKIFIKNIILCGENFPVNILTLIKKNLNLIIYLIVMDQPKRHHGPFFININPNMIK